MNRLDFFGSGAKTVLAPMAGYTDAAFRTICRGFGAALTVTEMVSSKALVMNNSLTETLLKRFEDAPCFVQIFGHEPQVMADSAQLDKMQDFEGLDINMGCPVRKIVSNGDGSALMQNPALASRCIAAVRKVWTKPLSVKFRLGVADSAGAADFAKMCADSGADFVTVHFRTRVQMYSGNADYSALADIVKCGIPVFANGDVTSRKQYLRLTEEGAYGVSVGRGALGRPYIFAMLAGQKGSADVQELILRHMRLLRSYLPDKVVANEMKKHAVCYLKGMRDAKKTATACALAHDSHTTEQLVRQYFEQYPQNRVVFYD